MRRERRGGEYYLGGACLLLGVSRRSSEPSPLSKAWELPRVRVGRDTLDIGAGGYRENDIASQHFGLIETEWGTSPSQRPPNAGKKRIVNPKGREGD